MLEGQENDLREGTQGNEGRMEMITEGGQVRGLSALHGISSLIIGS